MTLGKTLLVAACSATMLLAPVAAFAVPVAVGGADTRGAHSMSRHSMHHHSMSKKMMMKKQMMMKH